MDQAVFDFMADHRRRGMTRFLRMIVRLDGNLTFLVAAAAVVVLLLVWRRAWRPLLGVTLAYAMAQFVAAFMKDLIGRPRPAGRPGSMYQSMGGSAMPSSHALWGAAVLVTFLLLVRWRHRTAKVLAWMVGVAVLLLIGAAMTYVSAHWASDLLVGWGLGIVVALLAVPIADLLVTRWEQMSAVLPEPGPDRGAGGERNRIERRDVVDAERPVRTAGVVGGLPPVLGTRDRDRALRDDPVERHL
jgi:undecaprenyl-diphosphatase